VAIDATNVRMPDDLEPTMITRLRQESARAVDTLVSARYLR